MFPGRTNNSYYTLMASLPHLPHFGTAARLPINRVRLNERLKMLQPEDAALMERAKAFFHWRSSPVETTDSEMVGKYMLLEDLCRHASFGAVFGFLSDMKTITVALRRRYLGRPVPTVREPWGVGPWVDPIRRNWGDPNFKLTGVFPWIQQVREHIEKGEIRAMERVIFGVEWNYIDACAQGSEFGFDAVVYYLSKWDILDRWLAENPAEAESRFQAVLAEVTNEHQRLFD